MDIRHSLGGRRIYVQCTFMVDLPLQTRAQEPQQSSRLLQWITFYLKERSCGC